MTSSMTIQTLAAEVSSMFEARTRADGSKFVALKGDAPEWMTDLCREAHGEMMPDDHRYAFILEALDALGADDDTDGSDVYLEADVYTGELTAWLASRVDRFGYCDEAVEEFGMETFPGTVELLQMGQAREKNEVLDSVRGSLNDRLEAVGDDSADSE